MRSRGAPGRRSTAARDRRDARAARALILREAVEEARIAARRPSARRRGSRCAARAVVVPQRQRAAVRRRRADVGVGPDDLQAVPLERRARRMIAGSIDAACASVGTVNPGAISLVRAQPPTRSRALEDQRLQPALARNVAVDQAVVAAADDDNVGDVMRLRSTVRLLGVADQLRRPRRSRRTRRSRRRNDLRALAHAITTEWNDGQREEDVFFVCFVSSCPSWLTRHRCCSAPGSAAPRCVPARP